MVNLKAARSLNNCINCYIRIYPAVDSQTTVTNCVTMQLTNYKTLRGILVTKHSVSKPGHPKIQRSTIHTTQGNNKHALQPCNKQRLTWSTPLYSCRFPLYFIDPPRSNLPPQWNQSPAAWWKHQTEDFSFCQRHATRTLSKAFSGTKKAAANFVFQW